MSLNVQALTKAMIDAARGRVSGRWPKLRALAEVELRKLAENLLDIYALLQSGEIDVKRARQLVQMQQNAARGVLSTIKGLGVLTAEQATAAAIHAVAKPINAVFNFKLL